MATWRYIKGSQKDFEGAPEWATCKCYCSFDKANVNDDVAWCEGVFKGAKWSTVSDAQSTKCMDFPEQWHSIAQRERVTSINDDRLAQDMTLPRERIHKPDPNPVDPAIRYTRVDGAMFPDTNGEWVKTDTSTYEKIKPLIIDVVNHPKHYTQGGIECIDAIKAATVGKSGIEAVCVANVVKYLWRYEEKNGVEDVKKARWYLERLISELKEGESK